ncbi:MULTISPECIES: acyl carrier protein [Clostridium]|uniref:Acyl carrier protein n=1 Tax=Clostridium botulinum TaxID=1491 RepID=A0A6B4QX19_CLOBO|nr:MULTISPECIES: acyl carrier protein [Clostridium]MBN1034890.1 acyl carrier protein [Clostridium botulinum]MBN1057930.1 acyl carrier protein [Clostridium botulinum]MBN1061175.1 acyl carrier protein [Clostridium botulinum]MBN1064293.1 acyl carrier protein [Clostridium botulinum]MBN1070565.1 acyl carrier protein [Clostridium botulinum]
MLFEEIREIICEQLGVEKEGITLETTFEDLGADSLDLFQVVIELEEKFDIQIEEVEKLKSLKDAVEYVKNKTNN